LIECDIVEVVGSGRVAKEKKRRKIRRVSPPRRLISTSTLPPTSTHHIALIQGTGLVNMYSECHGWKWNGAKIAHNLSSRSAASGPSAHQDWML